MDDHKISENFQDVAGRNMISPHHFHPTNGVRPADSYLKKRPINEFYKKAGEMFDECVNAHKRFFEGD